MRRGVLWQIFVLLAHIVWKVPPPQLLVDQDIILLLLGPLGSYCPLQRTVNPLICPEGYYYCPIVSASYELLVTKDTCPEGRNMQPTLTLFNLGLSFCGIFQGSIEQAQLRSMSCRILLSNDLVRIVLSGLALRYCVQ